MINAKQITGLIKTTTINVVSSVNFATFTINDVNCKLGSLITVSQPLTEDSNANCGDDMDSIQLTCGKAINGSFTLSIKHEDPKQDIIGIFTINYIIN